MTKTKLIALPLSLGLMVVPALAAETVDPVPHEPDRSSVDNGDANRIICRREPILGSRLGVNRRCMTAAEWAQVRLDNRHQVERAQKDRPLEGYESGRI